MKQRFNQLWSNESSLFKICNFLFFFIKSLPICRLSKDHPFVTEEDLTQSYDNLHKDAKAALLNGEKNFCKQLRKIKILHVNTVNEDFEMEF